MTEDQLEQLYEEVKSVLFNKALNKDTMSEAQKIFSSAFEDYSFGVDMITSYANLVHLTPGINLRCLHAYCIGMALGQKYGNDKTTVNQTSH